MVLGIIPNTKFVYSLGHPLKGCLFYFPNFFSLIEFFYIWKYENHPRGNSLTVAKAAVPPRAPPCRPR